MLNYIEKYVNLKKDNFIILGIAGAINTKLIKNKVYKIKNFSTFSLIKKSSLVEKIFPNISLSEAEKSYNLASSLYPIWDEKSRQNAFEREIDMIDMETYPLIKICQEKNIKIECYKVISDFCYKSSKKSFLDDVDDTLQALREKFYLKM